MCVPLTSCVIYLVRNQLSVAFWICVGLTHGFNSQCRRRPEEIYRPIDFEINAYIISTKTCNEIQENEKEARSTKRLCKSMLELEYLITCLSASFQLFATKCYEVITHRHITSVIRSGGHSNQLHKTPLQRALHRHLFMLSIVLRVFSVEPST